MKIDFSMLISIFAAAITLFTTISSIKFRRKHEKESLQFQIEKIRYDIEKQLYFYNDRLLSTEDRWRDVNHLLISSQIQADKSRHSDNNISDYNFLKNFGILKSDIQVERDLVFLLTPFHNSKQDVYNVISRICTEANMRCRRGDEKFIEGDIMPHILENILKARLVAVNIDGRNPNVFYELGIAHALDKPTILFSKELTDVPFDLKSKTIILYKDEQDLSEKFRRSLASFLVE